MALSLLSVFISLQVFTDVVFAASNEESKIFVPPSLSYKPSPPLVKPPALPTTPIKSPTSTYPVKPPATPVTPTKPPVKSYPPQVKPPTSPLVKPPTYKPPTQTVKPPTTAPVQPPTYKPPTPLVKPPTIPPVKPPTAPVKPTPTTPVKSPVNPIPSPPVNAPPVKPLTPPAKPPTPPPVRTRIDCVPLCGTRCDQHSRKNVCMRACVTCCYRCKCVPPGTYGNKEMCGACYANMKTRGGRPKCP
ncbi:Gibberellin-regulated protein 14 [Hirschfeldia incana]|nr:Gibberellin-regulated protein 14 [Hirschfeldia incana]